jgi:hypothetical protein
MAMNGANGKRRERRDLAGLDMRGIITSLISIRRTVAARMLFVPVAAWGVACGRIVSWAWNCADGVETSNLVDVLIRLKQTCVIQIFGAVFAASTFLFAGHAAGQDAAGVVPAGPPPSSVGVFPLSKVKRGMRGTAWTVFEGTVPEAMEVEILGVLRGERGPGQDLILARLHGAKPEYTGVVAGMSGSPVYLDGKLLGALSYRIGQFSKEPIAGITPIEQMLEVRDLPLAGGEFAQSRGIPHLTAEARSDMGHPDDLNLGRSDGYSFVAMETPLMMSGFSPEAIRVWKERMAGTGLDVVSAGGGSVGGGTGSGDFGPVVPGSAVSLQMVSGDVEIAATCTVTYVDPKQLLACGHPVGQSGPVSFPMTETEVVATLASPLNAFKIVNTGKTIGAFTQDRDAGIRGEFGLKARMIPVTMAIRGRDAQGVEKTVDRKVEVLDLPSMTASAVLVSIYQMLLQTNESTSESSYHITGEIDVAGQSPVAVNSWGTPGEQMAAQLAAALGVAESFNKLYANGSRRLPVEGVRLHIDTIAKDMRTELEGVRLVSSSIVHAGDTVTVEATLRPWQQAARNVRMQFAIPASTAPGTLRLLVGSSSVVDRTLDAARQPSRPATLAAASERLRQMHAADRLYACLLLPESQASLEGNTLEQLPLSMANTMESERSGEDVSLHGESLVVAADVAAGGVLSGQQLLSLRVESGGGLH